ncbi:hypothetical protein LQZ19_08750 [Treponema primitia]|uniref:hypothetical protein n=1 Tax=Treponema primitia TaxID=88058 RepID=UPI00397F5618
MRGMIGKVSADPEIAPVKHGEKKALFLQCRFSGEDDVRTVMYFPGPGNESWPVKGDIVVVDRVGGILIATNIWDGAEPSLKPGERELYGRNAKGEKVSRIVMLDTGEILLESITGKTVTLKSSGDSLVEIGNAIATLGGILDELYTALNNFHSEGDPVAHTAKAWAASEITPLQQKSAKVFKK